ncbi:DUF4833 domain-containing protein [Mucilaginibacter hurinus]|uniref:DUF4833 domain-containing protein n=1 Tax=Mucilaginibacter hurinus TaxID=2201324 RepID=A0A367GRC2_9SPHI|nr:DUF4833 domain-containing protein [Mucilaginibacter hurinus]RCH56009.1 DUF4833 domain-containing protein [Mucilaginibacter hurinus]
MRLILLFFLISCSFSNAALSKPASFAADTIADNKLPVPTVNRLFYLQRDPNTNTVIYELNTDNSGILDKEDPIHPYWIRYADKGEKAELNFIQRKFAYGVNSKALGNDRYDIRFVSYKKIPFVLMKGTDGKYHIFVTISKRQIMLSRIFIRIKGGTFWVPNVIYMELRGTDTATGREVAERFKP